MQPKLPVAGVLVAVTLVLFAGCHPAARDQITDPHQQQVMSRVDALVKSTGGDWTKLSQADRDYLIQETGKGQEMPARMVFAARAGRAGDRHNVVGRH